jgi:hypothetical protein
VNENPSKKKKRIRIHTQRTSSAWQPTMADVTAASAWQCPTSPTVDPFTRYSGCTVGIELAQFFGWWNLFLWALVSLGFLFAAVKLHLHDQTSSLNRMCISDVVHAFALISIGSAMLCPVVSSAAWDPHTPVTSDLAIALSGGAGCMFWTIGAYKHACSTYIAGIFQMVYSLEQHKANKWTLRLNWLGLIAGYGHGAGCLLMCIGCHFARNQKESDIVVTASFTWMAIIILVVGCTFSYGALELRGLQKVISAQSSSGKTLKKLFPLVAFCAFQALNCSICMLLVPVVPWLRHRAGTLWIIQHRVRLSTIWFGSKKTPQPDSHEDGCMH